MMFTLAGKMSSDSAADAAAAAVSPALMVRSLPSSSVDAWLVHCATCFADKKPYPTPRTYFEAHMTKDTMLDINGIAIVECAARPAPVKEGEEEEAKNRPAIQPGTKEIAATTRIFVRRQYINDAEVTIGGVGEVCTKEQYRREGLAELALNRSIDYCRKLKLQLVLLHASPELSSFYSSRHAFRSVPRLIGSKSDFESEKDVNIIGEGLKHGPFSLRLMPISHFFAPTLLPQMKKIYEAYSKQFNGPIVRSNEYWENWVQSDLESSQGARHCFPIEIYAAFEEWDGSAPAPEPFSPIRFLSYMFLQRQPNKLDDGRSNRDRIYLVREYACADAWHNRPDGGRQMFLSLVQYAVRQIRHKFAEMDPSAAATSKFTVKFPKPIVEKFTVPLQMDEVTDDIGFMYRALPLDLSVGSSAIAAAARTEQTTMSTHRGLTVENGPIVSPFAASPFVLHHESEPMTETSAEEMLVSIQQETQKKVVFWQTDAF